MKAKVTGVSAWQGVPVSGTLDIKIPQRYVDSDGNATVAHYSGVLRTDGSGPRWVNAQNENEDLWTVVQGPLDPTGPLATFHEIVSYGPESDVRTTFTRRLVSSDLSGLLFDYAQPAPVNPAGFGAEPLTMTAARQLLGFVPQLEQATGEFEAVLQELADSKADSELSAAQALAANNRIPWYNGDHTTLPAAAGDYLIMRGAETGQTWTRETVGAAPYRNLALEAQSAAAVQATITDRIRSETIAAMKLSRGKARGDVRQIEGRSYWWDDQDVRADDGGTIIEAVGGGMGRWVLFEREAGISIRVFKYLVTDGCWIPAINAAAAIDNVFIPLSMTDFIIKPSNTNYIKIPAGKSRMISGKGASSRLKVADGNGAYQRIFGQSTTAEPLGDVRLYNFAIHQNPDNMSGDIVESQAASACSAIAFFNFDSVDIDRLYFPLATGINTITLNGPGCRNARVRNCDIKWGRKASNAQFDNSAIYVNCLEQKITDNSIRARSLADGAWGAIEAHGALAVVTGNTINKFRDGINLTPFSPNEAEQITSSILVAHNVMMGGGIGIRLWPITGKTMRNIQIHHNIIALAQSNWPTLLGNSGIAVMWSTSGTLDGDIDGLRIVHNDITFEATDARSNIAYSSTYGIGLAGNGSVRNAHIHDNCVSNAPCWAYQFGRAGKTITHLRAYNNTAINPGTAVNQLPAQARVALALVGTIIDGVVSRMTIIEDTPTAQAYGALYSSLAVGSDVLLDSFVISNPNNPALVLPTTAPAGVTIRRAPSLDQLNTWKATQRFQVIGATAIEAISDTGIGSYSQSTSGTAAYNKSTSGYGSHSLSLSNNASVAQQIGTLTANLTAATAYIIRSVAAGAFAVTAPTLLVDDAATGTNRTNALAEYRWSGVPVYRLSGGSHAMGAGIITLGGWARAAVPLDFPSIPAGEERELTISVPGAIVNDVVAMGPPSVRDAGLILLAPRVIAPDTVALTARNVSAAAIDPASANYRFFVYK